MRDFWLAYEGWSEVHVTQPQATGRMTNYFIASVMGGFKGKPNDLYQVIGEKQRKIEKAIIRPLTEEEKKLQEELMRGAANG
jgi:hypothetical protein